MYISAKRATTQECGETKQTGKKKEARKKIIKGEKPSTTTKRNTLGRDLATCDIFSPVDRFEIIRIYLNIAMMWLYL